MQDKDELLKKVKNILEDESIMSESETIHHEEIDEYKSTLKKVQIIDMIRIKSVMRTDISRRLQNEEKQQN